MVSKNIIEEAIKQSTKCVGFRFKHGAVVFNSKDNVIGRGYNHFFKNPSLIKYGYCKGSTHAEASAIIRTERNLLKGSSLLVIRRSIGGTKFSNSKPCSSCMNLIMDSGIKTVYFSNSNGFIEEVRL